MARVEIDQIVMRASDGSKILKPFPLAEVTINDHVEGGPFGSGAASTHWAAEVGGTGSTSSIATDEDGRISAWVEPGRYDLSIDIGGGVIYEQTYEAALGGASGGGGGAPSGPAGGVLSGSYPDPGFAVDMATQAELNAGLATKQSTSEKGNANGYASLDSGGKLPAAQLPTSAMEYKGTWNASTNSPTLADGSGDSGDQYRVGTAGTRDLGSGSIEFAVGDMVIYNGSIWQKSDTTDLVASVAGKVGVVTLDQADISGLVAALAAKQDASTAATDTELNAHINDTTDAHDASAISFDNIFGLLGLSATNVQDAIAEIASEKENVGNTYTFRTGSSFVIAGTISASLTVPVFWVPEGAAQVTTLIGIRHKCRTGSVTFKLTKGGADFGFGTTASPLTADTSATTDTDSGGTPDALVNEDEIELDIIGSSSGEDLSITLFFQHVVS